jgi:AcrR family transcriptional regulator
MGEEERFTDVRRRRVRVKIARVAVELFAVRGYEQVTVDEIAAAAEMSQRTFFRYFATKDEVVLEYAEHLTDRVVAVFRDRARSEGPVTALRNAFVVTSRVARDDREHVLRIGRILDASPVLRPVAQGQVMGSQVLLAEVAAHMGVKNKDPRPRAVVASMGAVAVSEWHAWVRDGGRGDPSERVGRALDILTVGLMTLDSPRLKESTAI